MTHASVCARLKERELIMSLPEAVSVRERRERGEPCWTETSAEGAGSCCHGTALLPSPGIEQNYPLKRLVLITLSSDLFCSGLLPSLATCLCSVLASMCHADLPLVVGSTHIQEDFLQSCLGDGVVQDHVHHTTLLFHQSEERHNFRLPVHHRK